MDKEAIKFAKMQGAGNDYVYIEALEEVPADLPLLSRIISNRHFGIGSDGLVAIMRSDKADFRMRMFNSDGSEAQMCGNASRCIGKYVYEKGLTDKTMVTLETLAGVKILRLDVKDGIVEHVEVDMGSPMLEPEKVPVVKSGSSPMVSEEVEIPEGKFRITAVSMGNPHGVVFTDRITDFLVLQAGPKLETADIWPEKANIEFVEVIDRGHIRMRVWERGTGETLACGTGACAAVVASVVNGHTDPEVEVSLPGGTLRVRWERDTDRVFLSGGADFIAEGVFYPTQALKANQQLI